jgi:hypothetical protein
MTPEHSPTLTPAGIQRCGIVAFAVLAGTLLLSSHDRWHGPMCPVWLLYHIHCPGCGLTRSFTELWRGHFQLALRYHPVGPPLFLLCVLATLAGLAQWRLPGARRQVAAAYARLISPRVLSPAVGLLLLLWVARLILESQKSSLFLW